MSVGTAQRQADRAASPRAVGLVVHSGRAEALQAAEQAARHLRDAGIKVLGCADDQWPPDVVEVRDPRGFASSVDLALVLGGDGTFLRAAYLVRDFGVPLLGVNLGRVGFLADVEADDLGQALDRIQTGDFSIEERMTLAVEVRGPDGARVASSWALNEASIERTSPQRLIVLEVRVGDTILADIPADAVICATPTGSTAYAFSAGGPILSPLVEAILLVPVAAHSLFNRTIVIDPGESLEVRPVGRDRQCLVGLDGRESLSVPPRGSVGISRGAKPVRMVRLSEFDFYARVRDKFGLR
ncbi:MAG TPA: NAD(+)/NADH kinase [Egibacteraceae bacterium]|nr:NAD(+)/NADH kinase [Egibacteraceae bacterium]